MTDENKTYVGYASRDPLCGEDIPEDFLKTVWISRLPGNLRALTTSQIKASLEDLAESASKVQDVAPQALQVHALGSTTHGTEISEIARQMTELTREVAALKAGNPPHTSRSGFRGSRAPFMSSRRQERSTSSPRDQSICWYCLTVIDRFTRWPESYPLADITAETCALAFISGWVARFGCPTKIATDRGRQFECELFRSLAAILGSEHRPTTSYHPACNGMIERLHRQLKAAIMCHTNTHWVEALPLVLLGIRSAWKEDIQSSAAELVYGEPLRLPGDFFKPSENTPVDYCNFVARLRNHMSKIMPVPGTRHSQRPFYIPKDLSSADYVFLRHGPVKGSLESPYTGPYKVLHRGSKTFKIVIAGKACTVTIDRLKPAYMSEDDWGNLSHSSATPNTPLIPQLPASAPNNPPLEREQTAERRTRSSRTVHFPPHLLDYRP
ncbi:uncharacterized protein LOC134744945 [Cydia strobilella]|uniref:uncharacterized protein LOC134744945 n=1 Tax=Cydia strobilella TaxID=1100964 RepID=UPI00300540DA